MKTSNSPGLRRARTPLADPRRELREEGVARAESEGVDPWSFRRAGGLAAAARPALDRRERRPCRLLEVRSAAQATRATSADRSLSREATGSRSLALERIRAGRSSSPCSSGASPPSRETVACPSRSNGCTSFPEAEKCPASLTDLGHRSARRLPCGADPAPQDGCQSSGLGDDVLVISVTSRRTGTR